jgi:hypothetical protein
MRFFVFCLLLVSGCWFAACAQNDSAAVKQNNAPDTANMRPAYVILPDSAELAKQKRIQFLADSFAAPYLTVDSTRKSLFYTKNITDFNAFLNIPPHDKVILAGGQNRKYRDAWLIAAIIGLLIYTALLNIFLGKDIKSVIQSFYNKQALAQLDMEGGLINSWAFIGLFVLFSLTSGLVLYQLTVYYGVSYSITGFQLFLSLSVMVSILFALKFFVLKLIGFVFDINRMVSEYIAVLNLTYFNIGFVLLTVGSCFSLLSSRFIPVLLVFTVAIIAIIFAWQYLRNSVSIISNIRFHKFYLFIYLCALEICPILILIKALNI